RHCRPEVDYVIANMHADGVPIDEHSTDRDSDSTAIALYVANRLRLRSKLTTPQLETWWNQQELSYHSLDGHYTLTTSTAVIIMEAYLYDDDVSYATKRTLWQRTMHILHERTWLDNLHHLSPLYTWENVVSAFFCNAPLFPEDQT